MHPRQSDAAGSRDDVAPEHTCLGPRRTGGGVDAQTGDIGDVIVEANGRPVHRLADLTAAIEEAGLGAAVTVKVVRDGRIRQVRVTTADVAENRR